MALIKIDNVELPNPSTYSGELVDFDASADRAGGYLRRNRIRSKVYQISASWTAITRANLKLIVDAMSPAKFTVTFFDGTTAGNTTAQMYAGNKKWALARTIDEEKPEESYWDLSVNLIEY